MNVLAVVAALSVMVAVILVMLAVYWNSAATHTGAARARLDTILGGAGSLNEAVVGAPLREERFSSFPVLSAIFSGKEWVRDVARELDRADLRLRVGEYVTIRIILAMLFFAIGLFVMGAGTVGMIVALLLAFVGYMMPRFYVARRKRARLQKLNGQLEETLTLTSNSMKAGFGLLQSLDRAAEQMDHPISTELRRLLHDVNVGSTTEQALTDLSQRVGSYDLDIVVTAILVQRTVGGNLAEILDTVSHTMRERIRIKGEIRVMTSQQRMTGYVLGGLPLVVAGILFLVARDYMVPLFTTTPGLAMLVIAGIWELVGVFLMRRILAIEV